MKSPDRAADETYQGWRNRETWTVHLWLTGEEPLYRFCNRLRDRIVKLAPSASQVKSGIWSVEQARKFLLADALKRLLERRNPLSDSPSVYAELLATALAAVTWEEIAEAFLEAKAP